MTTDEVIAKIKAKVNDEMKDHQEYCELARELDEHSMGDMAGIVRDIAHDERMHHDYLMAISTIL